MGRPGRSGPTATRSGPPETAGRWFWLPEVETDPTRRAHAVAEGLLDRHGVVTRGAVMSERAPGGFAGAYKVLSAFEETGRCRRGYFVDGLGAAQFGTAGAVDRLRSYLAEEPRPGEKPTAITLAATDPANPYGAALPWPDRGEQGHRPGRKAGALVVLVDGELTVYVERGGKTLLTFPAAGQRPTDTAGPAGPSGTGGSSAQAESDERLAVAIGSLGSVVRQGALGRLLVEKADGEEILGPRSETLRHALEQAGFVATSRGLRLRG